MTALPPAFADWFARNGWDPHPHQLALLAAREDTLLIAPTGGGKTLAGFLPSLVDLHQTGRKGLHTLYVSPLKALTADVARNLARPIEGIGLAVRVGDRTGDTPAGVRQRQRADPPEILLTTPESLALMLSWPEAPKLFAGLRRVVLDELHALAESKRGDQLMLGLARLRGLAPGLIATGLSATVEDPQALARFMGAARVIEADPGPMPDIALLPTRTPPPWAGGGGRYAVQDVLDAVAEARTTIIFLNTRAQAELFFQALWLANDRGLPIGLHHGALAREARQRVETAMAAGTLRAVVATGSLDLGIDWGEVDLVIQVGAPRNIKRLVQRIGRANHRYNAPSRARIVAANRFEVIECVAALEAARAGELDGEPRGPGPLDVLIQHILLTACAGPFEADALYAEVRTAGPYAGLSRADFDACLDFAATGGYALRAYDRWQRLMLRDGRWQLRDPRAARNLRMNIGTIVEAEKLKVRRRGRGGAALGEVEESFAATLAPGDTFLLGGQVLRYDRIRDLVMEVTPQPGREPKIAVFSGLKFATSTELSARMLAIIADPARHRELPGDIRAWLDLQARVSALPRPGTLVCETFPRNDRWHLVIYGFAGRNAHQTLGLLVTRQMEAAGLAPLGFLATDHALLITSLNPVEDVAPLLRRPALEQGLENWFADTSLMKRSFRAVATIAGLIQRNVPGHRQSGRQATFSSDIIHDTLRRHDPDHILLRATRDEARHGFVDFERIDDMLARNPHVELHRLDRVSPLAAPLLLEMGRIRLGGTGQEILAERMARELMASAGLDDLTHDDH
ncbi:ligase-associated DNA damage response DEXH box helicase [Sinirhodobacter populi]|uniref:Ligase-associated DNA damage response DEXH box helicase n=1 Tax=Paenirhodobacter populi TaxID=2306993 RepID=A0A443KDG7_9RHOB|nr:ligase-associated DNA damage response DEXH box helicase [Sinirhodobacter populi]RWR30643.1 ligase-associated DNA damage response DEXH box helicase [Sinirhodobacter populi]